MIQCIIRNGWSLGVKGGTLRNGLKHIKSEIRCGIASNGHTCTHERVLGNGPILHEERLCWLEPLRRINQRSAHNAGPGANRRLWVAATLKLKV